MSTGILTAGSGQPWENELVAALGKPGASLAVIRRCVDVAELLSVAGTGQAAVVLIAADLRRLSSDAIQRLTSAGVAVVGVYLAADQRAKLRLERMGVPAVVADDAGAEALGKLPELPSWSIPSMGHGRRRECPIRGRRCRPAASISIRRIRSRPTGWTPQNRRVDPAG